jgi:hypothetical protein
MKTKIQTTMRKSFIVLIACLALYITASAGTPVGDFRMLKNKNGIDLYYRWMQMSDGKQVRQMKAVLEINGGTEDVFKLLKDEKLAAGWIPSAEQFRNLTRIDGPEWVSYIQFAIPWPFADQDCILEYKSRVNASGETVIDFRTNPDYIATVDGISRMKDINGSFVIRQLPNGHSILECYFLSEKASVIPRWITEPIITGSILNLMEALRTEITEV